MTFGYTARVRWGTWIAWVGAGIATAATLASVVRVERLQQRELSYETVPHSLRELLAGPDATDHSARVGMAPLQQGQQAVFEFCSADGLPDAWADRVGLRLTKDGEQVLDAPLDAATLARAKRNDSGACLLLGSGPIKFDGLYAIDAYWEHEPPATVMDSPVRVRILGRPALGDKAAHTVIAIAVGIALLLLSLLRRPGAASGKDAALQARAGRGGWLGGAFAVGALALGSQLALPGSTLGVVKGVLLAALQIGLPLWLCRRLGSAPAIDQLGLHRPSLPALQLPVALGVGYALVHGARLSMRLVPRTGVAPIETFLSWPSGMLAFGALGVLLPLAEEVLFRGYLYRLALPLGRWTAGGISLGIFVAMHAQQAWGNWGALVSIAMTGTAMTLLRIWSGSTALPALAHLLYNFMLTMASF